MADTFTLGFKAFDAHELLCHAVAARAGLYDAEGLAPALCDLSFTPDDAPPEDALVVACGSALAGRLRGARLRVVFAACVRPMFWLRGRPDVPLQGARIATFPPAAPPAALLRVVLRGRGLDPDADVELVPARDDAARAGLVRAGAADHALLSSARLPPRGWGLDGGGELDVGAELPLPTTGLAASEALLDRDPALVERVVRAHRRALALVHDGAPEARAALESEFGVAPADVDAALTVVAPRLTTDGTADLDAALGAARRVARELGHPGAPALDGFYPG